MGEFENLGSLDQIRSEERESCAQIVLDRAKEAKAAGDMTLGLVLLSLALKIQNRVDALPSAKRVMSHGL